MATLKEDKNLVLKTKYRLMQVKSIAECSKWSLLRYFRPSLSYHLSLRSDFCLFFSGRLRQVLLYITLCPLGNFAYFLSSADLFQNQHFFKKFFQEYHQSVKQFGSRSGPTFCQAWSGSKLFAKLPADGTIGKEVQFQ